MALRFQSAHVTLKKIFILTLGVKIDTRNILFVGAGAFQHATPADLALEL
jgi:ATP-dependent protease HslVU (ClpYQ) ATPase subunit